MNGATVHTHHSGRSKYWLAGRLELGKEVHRLREGSWDLEFGFGWEHTAYIIGKEFERFWDGWICIQHTGDDEMHGLDI